MSAPASIISRVVSTLVREREAVGRRRHQRRRAARQQHDQRLAGVHAAARSPSARRPAASLRASGNGWLASIHSTLAGSAGVRDACRWPSPAESPGAACATNAAAIAAAALPTAIDVQRPRRSAARASAGSRQRARRSHDAALDRVDAGADDRERDRVRRLASGSGQWTLRGSDQADRPVTTSNSLSSLATTWSALALRRVDRARR